MRLHCESRRKSDLAPCEGWAMRGQKVCRMHGGAAPQARRAAAVRQVEAEARSLLAELGRPVEPVQNPLLELQLLAGEIVGWKRLMAEQVAKLTDLSTDSMVGPVALAEITLFERALDRCVTVLGLIARLDIDRRLVTISQAQGVQVSEVIREVVNAMHPTSEQREAAQVELTRQIERITGGEHR